ncbi:hypothetical protein GCM10027343_34040 [Noviherbaspirillum agri]
MVGVFVLLSESAPASGERRPAPVAPAAPSPPPLALLPLDGALPESPDPLASPTLPELPAVALSPLVPTVSPVPVAPPVEPIPSQRGLALLLPLVPVASSGPDEALLPLEEPLEVTVPSLWPDTPGVGAPPAFPMERVVALPEVDPESPGLTTALFPRGSSDCMLELPEDVSDGAPDVVPGNCAEAPPEADGLCAIDTGTVVSKDTKTANGNLFMLAPEKGDAGCDCLTAEPCVVPSRGGGSSQFISIAKRHSASRRRKTVSTAQDTGH